MNKRKVLIISGVVIGLSAIGFAVYWFFFKKKDTTTNTVSAPSTTNKTTVGQTNTQPIVSKTPLSDKMKSNIADLVMLFNNGSYTPMKSTNKSQLLGMAGGFILTADIIPLKQGTMIYGTFISSNGNIGINVPYVTNNTENSVFVPVEYMANLDRSTLLVVDIQGMSNSLPNPNPIYDQSIKDINGSQYVNDLPNPNPYYAQQ